MKKYIICLSAVLIAGIGNGFAQDIPQGEVPAAVMQSFNEKFPKASDIEWERKGELYEVEFVLGRFDDHEALFDASGNLTRHKGEIAKSSLPKAVADAIATKYPKYRIDDVDKITEGDRVTYKTELENGQEDFNVVFSEDGSVIN